MRNPPPLTRAFIWRRHFFVTAAFLLLAGCGTPNGDFGEVRPTLVSDGMHDWVGPYATGSVPSKFELTDDERALRDLATRWSILPMIGNNGIPLRANMASTGRRAGRRSTALLMRSGYSRATALRHWRVTRRSWKVCATTLRLSCRRTNARRRCAMRA